LSANADSFAHPMMQLETSHGKRRLNANTPSMKAVIDGLRAIILSYHACLMLRPGNQFIRLSRDAPISRALKSSCGISADISTFLNYASWPALGDHSSIL
jgi:hypothetical protein